MKLAIFNGSPRKEKSNSTVLINHFLKGFYNSDNHNQKIQYLAKISETNEHIEAFYLADTVIIIFPLYTDAMPGQVKFFFENIAHLQTEGKKVGFIVQSGFPESYHSKFIERYLKKLSNKMSWEYLGTVIKGGVEGIKIMPESMTKKLFINFMELGAYFKKTGKFKSDIKENLAKPYRLNTIRKGVFKIMISTGLANFYWRKKLKENNAYEKRFAQPYSQ